MAGTLQGVVCRGVVCRGVVCKGQCVGGNVQGQCAGGRVTGHTECCGVCKIISPPAEVGPLGTKVALYIGLLMYRTTSAKLEWKVKLEWKGNRKLFYSVFSPIKQLGFYKDCERIVQQPVQELCVCVCVCGHMLGKSSPCSRVCVAWNTRLLYCVPSLMLSAFTSSSPGNARGNPLRNMHGASTYKHCTCIHILHHLQPGTEPVKECHCLQKILKFPKHTGLKRHNYSGVAKWWQKGQFSPFSGSLLHVLTQVSVSDYLAEPPLFFQLLLQLVKRFSL